MTNLNMRSVRCTTCTLTLKQNHLNSVVISKPQNGETSYIKFRVDSMQFSLMVNYTFFSEVFECPADFFKCPDSFCIEKQFVCDGVPQCENGEDEQHCGKLASRVHFRTGVTP